MSEEIMKELFANEQYVGVCLDQEQVMFLCLDCSVKDPKTYVYFCSYCIRNGDHSTHKVIQIDNENITERCSCGDGEIYGFNAQCDAHTGYSAKISSDISQDTIKKCQQYCFQQFMLCFKKLETKSKQTNDKEELDEPSEEFLTTFTALTQKQPAICSAILTSVLPDFKTTHTCKSHSFDSNKSTQSFCTLCSCTVIENLLRHQKITDQHIRRIIIFAVQHRPFVYQIAKLFQRMSIPLFFDLLNEFNAPSLFQALISQASLIKYLSNVFEDMLEKLRGEDYEDYLKEQASLNNLLHFIFAREMEVDERTIKSICGIISKESPRNAASLTKLEQQEVLIITENLNLELSSLLLRSLHGKPNGESILEGLIYEFTTKCQCEVSLKGENSDEEDEETNLDKKKNQSPSKGKQTQKSSRIPFFQGSVAILGLLLQKALVYVYEKKKQESKNLVGDLEGIKDSFKEFVMKAAKLSEKGLELLSAGIIKRIARDILKIIILTPEAANLQMTSIFEAYRERLWSRDIATIQVFAMLLPVSQLSDSIIEALRYHQKVPPQNNLVDHSNILMLFEWIQSSQVSFVRSASSCFKTDMAFLSDLKASVCVSLFFGRETCSLSNLRQRFNQLTNPIIDSVNNHSLLRSRCPTLPSINGNYEEVSIEDQVETLILKFANLGKGHVATLIPSLVGKFSPAIHQEHPNLYSEQLNSLKERKMEPLLGNFVPSIHRHLFVPEIQVSPSFIKLLSQQIKQSPLSVGFGYALKLLHDLILFNQNYKPQAKAVVVPLNNHVRSTSTTGNVSKQEQKSKAETCKITTKKTNKETFNFFDDYEIDRKEQAKKEFVYGTQASQTLLKVVGLNQQLLSSIRKELKENQSLESSQILSSYEIFMNTLKSYSLIESEMNQSQVNKQNIISEEEKQRLKAQERQKAILEQFSSQQKKFQIQNVADLNKSELKQKTEVECTICKGDDHLLVFRAYIAADTLKSYLSLSESQNKHISSNQFSISSCQHLTHQKCHETGSSNVQINRHALSRRDKEAQLETFCTICKGLSNIAVPSLESILIKKPFNTEFIQLINNPKCDSCPEDPKNPQNKGISDFKSRVKLTLKEELIPEANKVNIIDQVVNGLEEFISLLSIISEQDQEEIVSDVKLFQVTTSLLSSLLSRVILANSMEQFKIKDFKLLLNLYLNAKIIFKRRGTEKEKWEQEMNKTKTDLNTIYDYFNAEIKRYNKDQMSSFVLQFSKKIFKIAILCNQNQAAIYSRKYLQYVMLAHSLQFISKETEFKEQLSAIWSDGEQSLDIRISCLPYFRIVSVFFLLIGQFDEKTFDKMFAKDDMDPEGELEVLDEIFGQYFTHFDYASELNIPMQSLIQQKFYYKSDFKLFSFGDKAFQIKNLPQNFDKFYRNQFWKKCEINFTFPDVQGSPLIMCLICGKQMADNGQENGEEIHNDVAHSQDYHSGACAFIQIQDSKLILVENEFVQTMYSLYTDKFGRSANCLKYTDWNNFTIDQAKLSEVTDFITSRKIPQQVRYALMQLEDDPFYFFEEDQGEN